MSVYYIDRQTGKRCREQVYGEWALRALYGSSLSSRIFRFFALAPLCKLPLFSQLYGWWQKQPWTRKNILPFIQEYGIDTSEFATSLEDFSSFNDFFIRKLRPEARPIVPDEDIAIIPADGRYFFYPNAKEIPESIHVKGQIFSLERLINDPSLAHDYRNGACVIGRLCPIDYHRFHFPVRGIPSAAKSISGYWYSVNPIALSHRFEILWENKRCYTPIATQQWGTVLMIEIGATNVGSIHQTYTPNSEVGKGEEKGYFSFGGSALVLLFPPDTLSFDEDLLAATKEGYEIRCLMGQSMGRRTRKKMRKSVL